MLRYRGEDVFRSFPAVVTADTRTIICTNAAANTDANKAYAAACDIAYAEKYADAVADICTHTAADTDADSLPHSNTNSKAHAAANGASNIPA